MTYSYRIRYLFFGMVLLTLVASTIACGLPLSTGSASPTLTPAAPTTNPTVALPTQTNTSQPTQTSAPAASATAAATAAAPTHTAPVIPTQTKAPAQLSEVTIYFVAVGDNGQSGPKIGCDDSLVAVKQPIEPTSGVIRAALNRLFSFKDQYIGESGLYTALWQSDLELESARVDSGVATVYLKGQVMLGGECDTPRFIGQIEQTILAQPGVTGVKVFLNGKPIQEALSLQ